MTNVRDAFTRWSRMGQDGEKMMETEAMQNDSAADSSRVDLEAGTETPHEAIAEPAVDDAAQAEIEQLRTAGDQLRDRLARLQAEFDNARKREVKERQDARDYAVQSTIEPFLGVMDNFQLALKADGSAEQLRSGVELILKQMEDALRNLNVQAVESIGSQFDPRIHEALGSIETVEHPDHEVLEEIRRGYKLRDKLLRPALVRIAANSAQVSD